MLCRKMSCCVLGTIVLIGPRLSWTTGADSDQRTGVSIEDVSWLQGAWVNESSGRRTEEHWIAPRGGTMLGLSRTIAGDRTVAFEYLRIEARGDDLVFLASPGGRCPATPFTLSSISTDRVVFENLEHDFPQRIIYQIAPDGTMKARIEGTSRGQEKHMEWTWTRE